MLRERIVGDLPESGELTLELEAYEATSLRVVGVLRTIA